MDFNADFEAFSDNERMIEDQFGNMTGLDCRYETGIRKGSCWFQEAEESLKESLKECSGWKDRIYIFNGISPIEGLHHEDCEA